MIHLELTYDDLRKIGVQNRKPEAALTACGPSAQGGMEVTVRADLATIPEIGKLIKSLIVSIVLDLSARPAGNGCVQLMLRDLSLDKSQAPLLIRPFLRPKIFKKTLYKAIAGKPGVTVDPETDTVVLDLNALAALQRLGLAVDVKRIDFNPDGVVLELTLAD